MTGMEVFVVLIGFVFIIISFFLSEKIQKNGSGSRDMVQVWSENDEKLVKERVNIILGQCVEGIVDDAETKLSKLCNEKIMAFSEYSDQTMKNIEKNNNHVVFLYDMLVEKQEEIKKITINTEKNTKDEDIAKDTTDQKDTEKKTTEKKPTSRKKKVVTNQAEKISEQSQKQENKIENDKKNETEYNQNDKVLDLYKKGLSIIEISKQLGIGQGEAKLVIDLFKEVK